jgi:hypothetical protein
MGAIVPMAAWVIRPSVDCADFAVVTVGQGDGPPALAAQALTRRLTATCIVGTEICIIPS